MNHTDPAYLAEELQLLNVAAKLEAMAKGIVESARTGYSVSPLELIALAKEVTNLVKQA